MWIKDLTCSCCSCYSNTFLPSAIEISQISIVSAINIISIIAIINIIFIVCDEINVIHQTNSISQIVFAESS